MHSNPRFENIYISNTLRDGFDIKNHESSNAGLVMRDIEVNCHAQGSEDLTDAQAGIDIRGHDSALYDIRVTGISGSARGIRFRSGTLGAMGSFVEGYEIECIDAVRTVGIELRAPDTSVQYGTITGCGVGVLRRIVEE